MVSDVAVLRHFNRAWTQRIGALDESFLGSGRPLGPSRLLFEIGGSPDGAVVRELRDRLGIDSGYLSRLLRQLEADGLVRVGPDPGDRRRRIATLTASGRSAWARLEDRSERLAERLVEPLTPRQRARLTEALATADVLCQDLTRELTGKRASDRYFRLVTSLGEKIAAGGFQSIAGIEPEAILMPYEN